MYQHYAKGRLTTLNIKLRSTSLLIPRHSKSTKPSKNRISGRVPQTIDLFPCLFVLLLRKGKSAEQICLGLRALQINQKTWSELLGVEIQHQMQMLHSCIIRCVRCCCNSWEATCLLWLLLLLIGSLQQAVYWQIWHRVNLQRWLRRLS